MNDTLAYMALDPVHRSYHHDKLTFGLLYAFSENFILPLSHDEVVHGKGSIVSKMPGDDWQKFANTARLLRLHVGPSRQEAAVHGPGVRPAREWNFDESLDWHLLDMRRTMGFRRLCATSTSSTATMPALHARDCEAEGFHGSSSTTPISRSSPLRAYWADRDDAGRRRVELHAGAAAGLPIGLPRAGRGAKSSTPTRRSMARRASAISARSMRAPRPSRDFPPAPNAGRHSRLLRIRQRSI